MAEGVGRASCWVKSEETCACWRYCRCIPEREEGGSALAPSRLKWLRKSDRRIDS